MARPPEASGPEPPTGKRRSRGALRIVAALLAIGLLASWTVLPRLFPPGRHLLGKPAPDFTLPIIANGEPGARLRLSELTGSVVVLDFWATWCEPCLLQAPILERVAAKHAEQVIVVGVNVADDTDLARRFVAAEKLSYPVVADEEGSVQAAYRAGTLPSLVVVDRSGNVAKYLRGVISQAAIEQAIERARRAPTSPAP